MDCEQVYQSVLNLDDKRGDYILFELASCFIKGFDPNKLSLMLTSHDEGIVSDGLFVLSEIGDLASNYVPELEALTRSGDDEIRATACELLAVYGKSER